jgi:hypothetical protein
VGGTHPGRGQLLKKLTRYTPTRPATLRGAVPPIPTGNEGVGLRTNVRRACTSLVRIDMGGAAAPGARRAPGGGGGDGGGAAVVVDSLNVSVAAGILLHHLLAARGR